MQKLPDVVVEAGEAIGRLRYELSLKQGRKDMKYDTRRSSLEVNLYGAIGEALFIWRYAEKNFPWRAVGSDKKLRDVAHYEIQTTKPGKGLIMRPRHARQGVPLDTPYVLVHLEKEDTWRGDIVGYMPLGEGLEHPRRRPVSFPGPKAYWIDCEHLYPIDALIQ